jgi:hypothetical protein
MIWPLSLLHIDRNAPPAVAQPKDRLAELTTWAAAEIAKRPPKPKDYTRWTISEAPGGFSVGSSSAYFVWVDYTHADGGRWDADVAQTDWGTAPTLVAALEFVKRRIAGKPLIVETIMEEQQS